MRAGMPWLDVGCGSGDVTLKTTALVGIDYRKLIWEAWTHYR